MIVRHAEEDLILITQPDHAALSRRIMGHWASLQGAQRRDSILHAIAGHDNGWSEPDSSPTVDPSTGQIYDFVTTPKEVREAIWPRGIERLAADPWAAALVAQHAITVYDSFRPSAEWAAFFEEMEQLRGRYVQAAGLALDLLMEDYGFLRLGDLASLAFCNGWTEEQRWKDYRMRLQGDRLLITPDPFAGLEFPIGVPGRLLPNRRYESDDDAAAAYRSAESYLCSGTVAGVRAAGGAGSV
jgi:hypothetical protein